MSIIRDFLAGSMRQVSSARSASSRIYETDMTVQAREQSPLRLSIKVKEQRQIPGRNVLFTSTCDLFASGSSSLRLQVLVSLYPETIPVNLNPNVQSSFCDLRDLRNWCYIASTVSVRENQRSQLQRLPRSMAPAVRTQDLFDKAGVEDDKEPVHPLERHKARAKDRSKLIRSMPKEHHRRPVTPDIEVHSITSPSPSRTPVPRQNRVDPPLTVDTTLLMNSMNNMNYMSQSATSASTQSSYPFADDASLLRYSAIPSSPMSMSLSVGVFSCEGDLPAFQDLFCTIRIGSSSSSMTEAAIAVPNEESVGVDWNQTYVLTFTFC